MNPKGCAIAPELAAVQHLMPMSNDDKQKLKDSIEKDGVRDPLKGYFDPESGVFQILSGQNRWEIALELNLSTLPVQSIETDDRQAFAIDENRARRQLSTDDKKRLAAWLLKRNPALSDLQTARQSGISDKTAANVRKGLVRRSEIPNAKKRTDSTGRTQPANKPGKVDSKAIKKPSEPPKGQAATRCLAAYNTIKDNLAGLSAGEWKALKSDLKKLIGTK